MKKKSKIEKYTDQEALDYHNSGKSGKIEINSSKPMSTQRDLALAYSPGVAAPVKVIAENPDAAYDYTTKGNLVAVISNGSAILGLGNLGALASKPVMEGKAVLFKRFADINAIDLEIDSSDPNEIINSITKFGKSFGGINLEDIAAPDCFIIEQKLKEKLDIPVFHDDQHGTAITTLAGLINALDISGKSIKNIKVVVTGAGASAIACANLFKVSGIPNENLIMLDSKGVLYKGRNNLDQWKSAHAIDTKVRTLKEAIDGADVFLGLSKKNILSKDMVKKMAKNPKFAIRVTEKRNGWSAEITRQVTSRKVVVSKRETGFDSEEKAQAWAEQELAGFVQNQVVRNERKAVQRQEREAEQLAAKVRKEEARQAREADADEE